MQVSVPIVIIVIGFGDLWGMKPILSFIGVYVSSTQTGTGRLRGRLTVHTPESRKNPLSWCRYQEDREQSKN